MVVLHPNIVEVSLEDDGFLAKQVHCSEPGMAVSLGSRPPTGIMWDASAVSCL